MYISAIRKRTGVKQQTALTVADGIFDINTAMAANNCQSATQLFAKLIATNDYKSITP